MEDLDKVEMTVLVDMLARHTAEYTKMLSDGISTQEEFKACKKTITLLQKEIESRKKNFPGNTSDAGSNKISPDYTE